MGPLSSSSGSSRCQGWTGIHTGQDRAVVMAADGSGVPQRGFPKGVGISLLDTQAGKLMSECQVD